MGSREEDDDDNSRAPSSAREKKLMEEEINDDPSLPEAEMRLEVLLDGLHVRQEGHEATR